MKFTMPDALPTDRVELDALAAQAAKEVAVFQARHNAGDEFTPDEVDRFEYLVTSGETIADAITAIETAEADTSDRLSGLMERSTPKPAAPEAPAAEAETPADPEPEPAAPEGDGGAAEVVAAAEQATQEAAAPVAVSAAAAKPVSFAAATKTDVPPTGPEAGDRNRWRLASTAPNFSLHDGALVDTGVLAEGIANPSGEFTGIRTDGQPTIIARTERPVGKLVETPEDFYTELERVTSEIPGVGRATAEALVAAGGWCAPSVQTFGFDPTNPAQGLLSVPEMNLPRGGIIIPDEPDFSALQTGFHFTESELEADSGSPDFIPTAIKPIVEIPCVEAMTEYRKEALGWGVKTGILQKRAWPELIRKFLDEFMVAHQQRISAKTLVKILAKSSAAKVIPNDVVLGATTGILNGLHQRARNIQIKRRTKTIGGIAPIWFRDVLKADLAMREGKDSLDVTDADVDRWLADRDIYLQYEGTWQSLGAGQPGHYDTAWWPGSVDVVLFPAGAFWRTLNNIVTVGVMYDITMLQQNRELVGFVEDEFQVGIKPSDVGSSHLIRIPLCVNGAVGARESIDCSTEFAATSTATFNFPGTPTGGGVTFHFTANPDMDSASVAFNDSNANVDTKLTAIDDGEGTISVVGGPLPGTAVTVTYPAALGDLEVTTNSLTGGTQPGAGVPIT